MGGVPRQTLSQFADVVAGALPATAAGVRFAGDPDSLVETVAVVGGSGASEPQAASRVADVLVTADLKHHTVDEHLADGGCAVIDVAHWARNGPGVLRPRTGSGDTRRELTSCQQVTDPWSGHRGERMKARSTGSEQLLELPQTDHRLAQLRREVETSQLKAAPKRRERQWSPRRRRW